MALDDLPSDETLKLLSNIHILMADANESVEVINKIQKQQIKMNGVQFFRLLNDCKKTLEGQTQMLTTLVERQLELDDQLKAAATTTE